MEIKKIRAEITEAENIFKIKKPEKIYKVKTGPCKYNKIGRLSGTTDDKTEKKQMVNRMKSGK